MTEYRDYNKEMKQEFENNKEKYAIPKQVVQRWVCKNCGKIHRFPRGYAYCKVSKIATKFWDGPLPTWEPKGTREQICENYEWTARWFRSFITYRIIERDKRTCQDCKKSSDDNHNLGLEVHHIIPVCCGGSDHPKNLKTLCVDCHRKETNDLLKNKDAYHRNLKDGGK